jgi:hypothetical protein
MPKWVLAVFENSENLSSILQHSDPHVLTHLFLVSSLLASFGFTSRLFLLVPSLGALWLWLS